ncbi:MAG TPA: alpha/beta hydrolase [Candidatus Dormibacteraeota bacterium]|jgi:pimeloyl-ACP methyl ester carboxylesterase
MPLAEIDRQWINYEDTGGNIGPIVFAHGLLMDREMFAPQIAAARAGSRFVTWDARCHGDTENTDDPFSYWDLADDLKGLLDQLGIERAVIGGMCQGGFIALRFALKYPERVSALILIGTQAGIQDPEKVAIYQAMLDGGQADGLNDQLARRIAAIIFGNEWRDSAEWIVKWKQKPRSLLGQAFQTLVTRDDIHHRLGEIKAPALVIHGTADAAIDIEKAQRMCSELARCEQFVAIEGAGHAANLTHPKLVNLAIQQFLAGLELSVPQRAEQRANGLPPDVERRSRERRNQTDGGGQVVAPVDRRMAKRRAG